jgi:hypothetical protein
MNTKLMIAVAGTLALTLGACEEKKEGAAGMLDKAAGAANKAVEATKDGASKAVEATKDAAAKGTEAVKDAAAAGTEAVKDGAAKAGDMAAAGWEAAKKALIGDQTTAFGDFSKQATELTKKVDALPAGVKEPVAKALDAVKAQLSEGETLLKSLTSAGEKDYKGIADKLGALVPQIKDGLAKVTAMLPK